MNDQDKTPPTAGPAEVIRAWAGQLRPVETEETSLAEATGRVLAHSLVADRDCPPLDVSAMDGYAVRVADVERRPVSLPIAGDALVGQPPLRLPPRSAIRIVTGAPVPPGAEAVLRREWVTEGPDQIEISEGVECSVGQDTRRRGENARAGDVVVPAGTLLTAAVVGAAAGFGYARVEVFRRVRLAILVTGNELVEITAQPEPWQVRDNNSWALRSLLATAPFVEVVSVHHVPDDLPKLVSSLASVLESADLVLLTGGVSMGDRDFVRPALEELEATIVFHKFPIRPGKPLLGAVCRGTPVIGLPGNPVSVLVTATRFAGIIIRRLAGLATWDPPPAQVKVDNPQVANPRLWLYRPVRFVGPGEVGLLPTRGSGDFVSAARADGFVEIPPDSQGVATRNFYRWSLI